MPTLWRLKLAKWIRDGSRSLSEWVAPELEDIDDLIKEAEKLDQQERVPMMSISAFIGGMS